MSIVRPRGTNDLLPEETAKWQAVEGLLHGLCREFGYQEIRTPIFEHTELFVRGVGDSTDIVQKEMYTFTDGGGRSLTLRPENTAAVARAYLENKLAGQAQPIKLYYIGPMFRYERPQAGRFRQFHQFGIEAFGSTHPLLDAETILLGWECLERLNLKEKTLFVSSVGCPVCRPVHREALQKYLAPHLQALCPLCQDRYERNPMRILDCKNEDCQSLLTEAPVMLRHLCPECDEHFKRVQELLDAAGIPYTINPKLVRGLDYYTKTAFEIHSQSIGAKGALCGGGRYDELVQDIGGKSVPGVGLAMGMERIITALESQGEEIAPPECIDVYIALLNQEHELENAAFALTQELRRRGFIAEQDLLNRSLKSQLKQADRLKARYAVLLGGEEWSNQQAMIREMATSEQITVDRDAIIKYLIEK